MGSAAMGRKVGVLILIRKGLRLKTISTDVDGAGRRASILFEDGGVQFRVTNIYASNSPSTAYIQELSSWIAQQPQINHYITGDFNCTMMDLEDRTTKRFAPKNHSRETDEVSPLATFVASMQLT